MCGHGAYSISLGIAINLQNSKVLESTFSQNNATLVFTYKFHVVSCYRTFFFLFLPLGFSIFSCEFSSTLTFIVILPSSDCFVGQKKSSKYLKNQIARGRMIIIPLLLSHLLMSSGVKHGPQGCSLFCSLLGERKTELEYGTLLL